MWLFGKEIKKCIECKSECAVKFKIKGDLMKKIQWGFFVDILFLCGMGNIWRSLEWGWGQWEWGGVWYLVKMGSCTIQEL